jgi:choloylglycine hydrolase
MCTAMTLQSAENVNFFGRTMDFSYCIEPAIYKVPKNNEWINILTMQKFHDYYSFIGIGQESDGLLGFFDGVNEKGFAAAALYFAGYACFDTQQKSFDRIPVASLDFLHYILGRCVTVEDLYDLINDISIVGIPDPVTRIVAPLHWIATDRSGRSVVIEMTKDGLMIYENSIGVMSNSPDFPWHLTNLRNYMEVSTTQSPEEFWGNVKLTPFGQAGGTLLLPGGYTSPERFVRTAYLKTHITKPINNDDMVIESFHILESVSIPKGIVITQTGAKDYTKYIAFMNTNTCEYYFKTYENPQITTVGLRNTYGFAVKPNCLGKLERPILFDQL